MAGKSLRRGRERGFTLVEILVVITIIAALISIVAAVIPQAQQANRKLQCANNLKNIGGMLMERTSSNKGLGTRGGAALLLQTYKLGMIRKGDERVFLCPGDVIIRGQNIDDADFKKRYDSIDLDHIDPLICSYAGRNRKLYRIDPGSREKQAYGCDCQGDDGRSSHHKGGVNVLYDDASVVFMDHEALGLQPDDPIVVGIESTQELLKQFCVSEQ